MLEIKDFKIQPRLTITDEVYDFLRQKILTGEIEKGERLIASKIAEELQISRTPIRDSLNRLEMEGLIYPMPKAGYVVSGISEEDVEEIIEIRIITESLAAKWASTRITSDELQILENLIIKMDNYLQNKEIDEAVKLDGEFHDLICKISGSRRIEEITQRLRDHSVMFRYKALNMEEIGSKSNVGHRQIFEAIKKGDFTEIEIAYKNHLSIAKELLLNAIRNE
jgi:DNA-binding GntR family transcriptional regulator